jgi:hypothetical protein
MTMINPIGRLAVLLTRVDEQERTSERQTEDAAEQAAMRDANAHVDQLLAKADADRDEALASGIGNIAGGACSVGAAFFPATNSSGSTESASSASSASSATRRGVDWNAALEGLAKALPGVGDVVASEYKGEADRDDAEAVRFDAQAQADIRRYDQAQSDEQATNAAMQKVEQFVDQAQQAENAARLAAATFRS